MIGADNQSGQRTTLGRSLVFEGKSNPGRFRVALLAFAVLYVANGVGAGQRELNLNRSLYVPIRFVVCQHVTNVAISVRGDETVFPLGLRTFLFTYDIDRQRILPQFIDVRISGENVNSGHRFVTNVIITPDGVYSSVDSGSVDWERLKKQALVRRDIRFPVRQVLITADPDCEKKAAAVTDSSEWAKSAETLSQAASPAIEDVPNPRF